MAFSITIAERQLDKPILQSLTSTGVANPVHEPGYTVMSNDGREFVYVQFDSSSVAAVAGAPAVWASTSADNEFVVTSDVSDGGLVAVGAFLSILTDTYFGWIQTKGFLKDVPCTGAQDEVAVTAAVGATVDAKWSTVTVGGTTAEKGVALETSSGGYGNINLVS